jgi:hypothetical protein
MQSIAELRYELNMMRKNGRPKGTNKALWHKRMESIKKRLVELENSVDVYPEPSSGTMYNSFWKVSEKNIMRETLGTGWDHKRSNITDMTKNSTVPSLMGRELRDAIKKRFKK